MTLNEKQDTVNHGFSNLDKLVHRVLQTWTLFNGFPAFLVFSQLFCSRNRCQKLMQPLN